MKTALIIARTSGESGVIGTCLADNYIIDKVEDKETCLTKLRNKRYELIFIDIDLLLSREEDTGPTNYKKILSPFWQTFPSAEIIVLAPQEQVRLAVNAVKAGASNYLTYPLSEAEIRFVTESLHEAQRMQSELDYLRKEFWQSDSLEVVRTNSPTMKAVFDKVRSVSATNSSVLINGETGVGKGVIARIIHRHSEKYENQFVSVHCGAIPETLIESELFGHEKGSFTGAIKRKLGKFEIADRGTIFLDEIGTIPRAAQIKLLSVLQDHVFSRVGGVEVIETGARVIAATNVNLEELCDAGEFRRDLFYRLNVFPIDVPPLRQRIEDIPLLVDGFLKKLNRLQTKEIHDIQPEVMEAFELYQWPGNIRELENLIERAYILETSSVLTTESFPGELFAKKAPSAKLTVDTAYTISHVKKRAMENIERQYLKELLTLKKGKIAESADVAGITTRQLNKLMNKYSLKKEMFKN
ncbi:MAG: sigma-54 dependent transcriptional regulator [Nitrospinota bacterium]|nr:sigma-54 dependent transcriptional regulator [Nitrospinota bacterium]